MNYLKQLVKSKTINLNALYLALIAVLTEGLGVSIDPNAVVAIQTLLNIVLRHVTTTPLMDK